MGRITRGAGGRGRGERGEREERGRRKGEGRTWVLALASAGRAAGTPNKAAADAAALRGRDARRPPPSSSSSSLTATAALAAAFPLLLPPPPPAADDDEAAAGPSFSKKAAYGGAPSVGLARRLSGTATHLAAVSTNLESAPESTQVTLVFVEIWRSREGQSIRGG